MRELQKDLTQTSSRHFLGEAVFWALVLAMLLVTASVAHSRGAAAALPLLPGPCYVASLQLILLIAAAFARSTKPGTWRRLAPNLTLWRVGLTILPVTSWLYQVGLATDIAAPSLLTTIRRGFGAVGLVLLAVALWRTARAQAAGEPPPPHP